MKSKAIPVLFLILLYLCNCRAEVYVGRETAHELVEDIVGRTEELYRDILEDKPYHPSLFAWGMHYLARTCLIMYRVTSNRTWLDRALNLTDYLYLYSDVNGDGVPSWGSYNDTWGIPKWEFKEYTVWDAVNCLPMIEFASLVRSDPELLADPGLSSRADSYLELVRGVVVRHYPAWTQVTPDQGYYWDDPTEDVGPYVNGFASLGTVELLLYNLTGNETYLERPGQMANYLIANMHHDAEGDTYTWDYHVGEQPTEDLSHGAIDLEFLISANRMGLVEDLHIRRICNAYQELIWNVPNLPREGFPLWMRVDGSGDEDYTRLSRGWVNLAAYVPEIYEQQRVALGIHQERHGFNPAGYEAEAIAQLLYWDGLLRSQGIDPGTLEVVDLELLEEMLGYACQRLNHTASLGADVGAIKDTLDEAAALIAEGDLEKASVPIAMIWVAWDGMTGAIQTGEELRGLEEETAEAVSIGADVAQIEGNISLLWDMMGETSDFAQISSRIGELRLELSRALAEALIALADEVIAAARELGIDTSRHEIFLNRAHEEFDEGNYGSAMMFTEYPLRLRDEVGEPSLLIAAVLSVAYLFIPRSPISET